MTTTTTKMILTTVMMVMIKKTKKGEENQEKKLPRCVILISVSFKKELLTLSFRKRTKF